MAVSLNGDGTITGLSTLNSVTITGLTSLTTTDLTADTTTLVVDSANNRVGIGTASPSTTLQVVGTATATAFSGPLTGNVTGDVSGNAGTVTNGVYTTDIGSTVQAYDADLTTLAGLSSADGNFIVGSATGWVVESGATARTSLGLGTAATTASTDYATAAQGTTADSALQPGDIGSSVQAYDADTAKLDTTQTWTAAQTYGDNVKQQFGASSDLQIYHSGTNSYIDDAGTGDLNIRGANVNIQTAAGSNYFTGSSNVATLYHTGNAKLATTSGGVTVTGTVAATAYTGDGSALTGIGGGGFSNMQVFTGSGTWTNPGSVTKVKVTVIGGGGGGGGSLPADAYCMSGGGGGGGTAIEVITIPTSPVPVTVGGGGAGGSPAPGTGSPGGTGGTSSFGGYCSATGGLGSEKGSVAYRVHTGANGGAGSGGNLNFKGGTGFPRGREVITSPEVSYFGQGTGGTTYLSGGSPLRISTPPNGTPGTNGDAYGGGGSGCGNRAIGGTGAPGVVIVEY